MKKNVITTLSRGVHSIDNKKTEKVKTEET